jgi:hypothetical protein
MELVGMATKNTRRHKNGKGGRWKREEAESAEGLRSEPASRGSAEPAVHPEMKEACATIRKI